MKTAEIEVLNRLGLHARASAQIVRSASGFESKITLSNERESVNAKGIMGLMMLAATQGSKLTLEVDGTDEEQAFESIKNLFLDRFGEGE